MLRMRLRSIGIVATLCATTGCKKQTSDSKPAAPAAVVAAETTVAREPSEQRYDSPVERRLYSDRVEASSFLWTDWNRFVENYHPNYALDGDPNTAWVEGADTSGAGQWLRIHISPVTGVTHARLRLRNGYHKSASLFAKNARVRKLEVVLLPGGQRHMVTLADDMTWQQVAFGANADRVDAIELRVGEVYEGKKYQDLCLSDVEVFITGLTRDNPAFEQRKLARLTAWKKQRVAAAAAFQGKRASELPIGPGYRVTTETRQLPVATPTTAAGLIAAAQALIPEAAEALARAAAQHQDWSWVKLDTSKVLAIPDVDGLVETGDMLEQWGDEFLIPENLVDSSVLTTFDTTAGVPTDTDDCESGERYLQRRPRHSAEGPNVRELRLHYCHVVDDRDGTWSEFSEALLVFAADGRLELVIDDQSLTWYSWTTTGKQRRIESGVRINSYGQVDRMSLITEVAIR